LLRRQQRTFTERIEQLRGWQRTAGKWTLRVVVLVLILVALDVAILAYPNLLFAHKSRFHEFTVYSNEPLPSQFDRVIDDVRKRIQSMEKARPGAPCDIYLCDTEKLYSFFTRLTRMPSDSMAFCLSAFGNIYMNETKIRRIAEHNTGGIRHCRYQGDYAELIAHEIAHFNVVKSLGFRRTVGMPLWKNEGYAEYQANIAATRADSSYAFSDRVDLFLNVAFWGGEDSIARRLYKWHILVEFLAEEKGYGLEELIDESVTESSTLNEMLAWYERRGAQRDPALD
jgi:hypothetical protein